MLATVYKHLHYDIFFPWLRYVYPAFKRRNENFFGALKAMFRTVIDERIGTLSSEAKPNASETQWYKCVLA